MTKKTKEVFKKELIDSLRIIENDIGQLWTFPLACQSISVQLNKLLCDKIPLLNRVISYPLFHPMRHPIDPKTYLLAMGLRTEFDGSNVKISYCYDNDKPKISLRQWLDQIIMVVEEIDLTIEDVIKYPRNKEAAHSDMRKHPKIEAMEKAFVLRHGGVEHYSYHIIIATIAAYAVKVIKEIINNNP